MENVTLNLQTERDLAFAGDWHTDIEWMLDIIRKSHTSNPYDFLFHVGDFGYGLHKDDETEEAAMLRLSNLLNELGITVYVTLGNHENWERFNNLIPNDDGIFELWDNIYAFPRGYRFSVNGKSFTSFGGAASINFLDLQEGFDWFREEAITMGDLYRLSDEQSSVLITHDAPVEIKALNERMTKLSEKWSEEGLRYSEQSQMMISAAVAKVNPMMMFHGHYHTDYVEASTVEDHQFLSIGLNMNGRHRNICFLTTSNFELTWFDQ